MIIHTEFFIELEEIFPSCYKGFGKTDAGLQDGFQNDAVLHPMHSQDMLRSS